VLLSIRVVLLLHSTPCTGQHTLHWAAHLALGSTHRAVYATLGGRRVGRKKADLFPAVGDMEEARSEEGAVMARSPKSSLPRFVYSTNNTGFAAPFGGAASNRDCFGEAAILCSFVTSSMTELPYDEIGVEMAWICFKSPGFGRSNEGELNASLETSCSTRLMSANSCSKSSSSLCNFFCASLLVETMGEENPGVGIRRGGGGVPEGPVADATADPIVDDRIGCGAAMMTCGAGAGDGARTSPPLLAPGRPMYLIVRRGCAGDEVLDLPSPFI